MDDDLAIRGSGNVLAEANAQTIDLFCDFPVGGGGCTSDRNRP